MLVTAKADIYMGERRGGGGGVRDQLKPCFSVLADEYGKFFLKLWHRSASACRDIQAGRTEPDSYSKHWFLTSGRCRKAMLGV